MRQTLLLEIAKKERELDELEKVVPWWPPLPRIRTRGSAILVSIGLVACLGGLACVAAAIVWTSETPASLRAVVQRAPVIPWRQYTGVSDSREPCDLWLSPLGLAEVECGGRVLYHGFGRIDAYGRFHSVALSQDHGATIDVRGRLATIYCHHGLVYTRISLRPDTTR